MGSVSRIYALRSLPVDALTEEVVAVTHAEAFAFVAEELRKNCPNAIPYTLILADALLKEGRDRKPPVAVTGAHTRPKRTLLG